MIRDQSALGRGHQHHQADDERRDPEQVGTSDGRGVVGLTRS